MIEEAILAKDEFNDEYDLKSVAKDIFNIILAKSLKDKISKLRNDGMKKSFVVLFHNFEKEVVTSYDYSFQYDPNFYPITKQYDGEYGICDFKKHYYGKNKIQQFDSKEEYECAKAIDSIKLIETWVRNISKQLFSLPTPTDKFYPDFVCKLTDGRMAIIEYKGADRIDNPEERDKDEIGKNWATKSDGKCIFLFVSKKISDDLYTQILTGLKK